MEVESKYSLNDSVYMLINASIKHAKINSFRVDVDAKGNVQVIYNVMVINGSNNAVSAAESNLFSTKVECAYSWLKKQELDPREVIQGFLASRGEE